MSSSKFRHDLAGVCSLTPTQNPGHKSWICWNQKFSPSLWWICCSVSGLKKKFFWNLGIWKWKVSGNYEFWVFFASPRRWEGMGEKRARTDRKRLHVSSQTFFQSCVSGINKWNKWDILLLSLPLIISRWPRRDMDKLSWQVREKSWKNPLSATQSTLPHMGGQGKALPWWKTVGKGIKKVIFEWRKASLTWQSRSQTAKIFSFYSGSKRRGQDFSDE